MAFTSVAHHAMPILTYRSCTQAVRSCSGTSRVCVCVFGMFACLRACMRLHARAIISVCSFIVYMSGSQDTHELREASIVFKGMYMYKHIYTCIHVYVHMAFTSEHTMQCPY